MPNPLVPMGFGVISALGSNWLEWAKAKWAMGERKQGMIGSGPENGMPWAEDSTLGWAQEQATPFMDVANWTAARGGPSYSFGGSTIRDTGTPGVNLDEYFAPSESVADAYKGAFGEGYDYSGLSDKLGEILSGTSVEAFKSKGLSDVGTASKGRLGEAMTGQAAGALSSGQSLSEISDRQALMGMLEGESRSSQVGDIEAAAENFNNQLAISKAGMMKDIGLQEGQEFMTNAQNVMGATQQDVSNTSAGRTMGFNAANMISEEQIADFARAAGITVDQARFQANQIAAMLSDSGGYIQGMQLSSPDLAGIYQNNQLINSMQPKSGGFGFQGEVNGYGGGINMGGCIDGRSVVDARGPWMKNLSAVEPGDEVLGEDGEYHRVIAKDFGVVSENLRLPMVRIVTNSSSIAVTTDHLIEGRRAEDWRAGDKIRVGGLRLPVIRIDTVPYIPSGDLILEGGGRYLANGFAVDSQLGAKGIDLYRTGLTEMNEKNGGQLVIDGFIHDRKNSSGGWVIAEEKHDHVMV